MRSSPDPAELQRIDHASTLVPGGLRAAVADSRIVATGVLFSRLTGFGRIATAAAVLGPTFFGNLFQTTAVLPSTLYGLLMGSLVQALLVPPLVQRINQGDPSNVRRFTRDILGLMSTVLFGMGLLILLLSPVILRMITSAVTDPVLRDEEIQLGLPLLAMMTPQLMLYGVAGAGLAVQQVHGRFALAAIAPAVENVVTIAVLIGVALMFGTGVDTKDVHTGQLWLLGLGTTAAVALHAAVQWYGAYRVGVKLMPGFRWRDPDLQGILRKGGASIGYTGFYWAAFLTMLILAGGVPGGVVALQIGANFCGVAVALTATPLASALLPRLSASYHRRDEAAFRSIYQDGLRLTLIAAVPAGLILLTMPQALAGAAAFGSMAGSGSVVLVAACIGSLGLGVIGESSLVLTTSAFYARHDAGQPLRAMALRFMIAALGALLTRLLSQSAITLLAGLGMSLAAANLAAGLYLQRRLRQALPRDVPTGSGLLGALGISAISLIPALSLQACIGDRFGTASERVLFALTLLGITITLYLAIQVWRGSQDIRLLLPMSIGNWLFRARAAES